MKVFVLGVFMLLGIMRAQAQVTVTATAGVVGPTVYTQLRLAFNAINAGTHQGAINISLTAGTTEIATAILNQNALPANYTSVRIKPAIGATPVITGNLAGTSIVHLFGARNVTFDGSNTAGGTTRDLTIQNTTFTAGSAAIRFGSPSTLVGATNDTIKNCIVRMSATNVGIAITSGSGVALFGIGEAPNSNNTIENCNVTSAQTAIYAYGPAALDNNWVIRNNDCVGLGFSGIHVNNGNNTNIVENRISNVSINGGTSVQGIILSFQAANSTITRNKVTNISNTIASGAYGIYLDMNTTATNVNVYNNFVTDVTCPGSAVIGNNAHGFFMDGGNGVNFHYNSVQLNTNSTGVFTNAAAGFEPFAAGTILAGAVNMRNNILSNNQTAGNRYAIYSTIAATTFPVIDYNNYITSAGGILGFLGGNRTTIAQIQAGFGGNLNSITMTPLFVSTTDLHLQLLPANNPLVAGIPIAAPSITVDIDNAPRSTTTPTIGAHELPNRITYTSLANTCSAGDIILTPVTIESAAGVPTAGAVVPRVYFRKGAGAWFSNPGTLVSGTATNGVWTFTISVATMGGVVAGDVISYYVVAQTTGGAIFGNPSTGLTAVNVNAITTPPTTPNTYTVNTVSMSGLTLNNNTCFNPSGASILNYAYTGTTGAPNQYTLTWSPIGPSTVGTFAALPASPILVNVPATTAPNIYTGAITIRNSTTTCTQVYTVTLTVDPLPAAITGSGAVCIGSSTLLSSTTTGGTWISSSPATASIGLTTGVVSGISGGTANITYTLPTGCSRTSTINVVVPPGAITGPSRLCPSTTITLSNPSPGGLWFSSTPGAVIDTFTGVLTGISPGNATISYSVPGCSPVTKIVTVDATPANITGRLYACETFSDTLFSATPGGIWTSASPSIATIGSTTGIFVGISNGATNITYTNPVTGCFITNNVTIFDIPGPIVGGPVLCQGLSILLSNSVTGGTWSSTLPGVVSINATTGIALGVAPSGTSTITYTLGTGCNASIVLTVSTPPTAISGGSATICTGYTANFSNGTTGGTWTSSNTTVATVSATGVVTGVTAGVVTISYSTVACNPAVYTVTVNQTPPPITGGITICNGSSTTTLTNATPGGVWTISGGATINSAGFVTGLAVGGTYVSTYTMPNACFVNAPIIVDTIPAPIAGADSVCQGRSDTLTTAATGGLWSSNNAMIASVVATTGIVTGVNHGLTTISYTAVSGCTTTKPFRVSFPLPASVTVTRNPGLDTLCAGIPVTFKARHINGGLTPRYQWQLFGVNVGINDTVYTYTPTHGDVISCFMTNSDDVCALPSPAYVNEPINVYPNVIPVVNITITSDTIITYLGQVVTFYAEVTTAGGAPTYQWFVDGDLIPGATNSVYAREVYDDDSVFCRVNGTPACDLGSVAASNLIRIRGTYLAVGSVNNFETALSLFPNPNMGSFTLSGTMASTNGEVVSVEVMNVVGQKVYSGFTTVKNGNLKHEVAVGDNIAPGTYLLKVSGESETKIFHFVVGK
jgi:hypothetical protein